MASYDYGAVIDALLAEEQAGWFMDADELCLDWSTGETLQVPLSVS